MGIDGMKVFSATRNADREVLGERATTWISQHPELDIVDVRVLQSSDNAYHCLTIVLIYSRKRKP